MRFENNPNIGIVTSPLTNASRTPVSNLVDALFSISNDIYFITGNAGCDLFKENKKIHTYGIQYKLGSNAFTKVIRHFCMQLRISYKLIWIARNANLWIFFIANGLLLPMIVTKLLRKDVVLALAGSSQQGLKFTNDNLYAAGKSLERINFTLSDRIIVYSPNLIKEWNLEKYRQKISIAHRHFLDFSKFKVEKPLEKRENLIGYIGRLSEEKGILSFIEAIPKALEREDSVEILIGGDGQLRGKVERYLNEQNLNNKVKFVGWIPHDELPDYLNKLKLLVLPSYTEGLPNIILEAMACGTPVLATPVGGVPDVIKDSETGFIMEDNSPECIARNVIRVFNHPNLEQITRNARALIEKEYTYEKAVERYRKILASLK